MTWRILSSDEEETPTDEYSIRAKERILQIIGDEGVVTERELKVRLERDKISEEKHGIRGYFPWVTGFAMRDLINKEEIKVFGYAGRRRLGSHIPSNFYALSGTRYADVVKKISEKRDLSAYLNNSLLTNEGIAGFHAEDLFLDAFESLGFDIKGRDVSEYGGHRVPSRETGPPKNIDFVVDKDDITYGVDIKNWLKYEQGKRLEVFHKVRVAEILDTTPFMIVRYIDDNTMYHIITHPETSALVYRYWDLLVPPEFKELAERISNTLGFPILATDELPKDKINEIKSLHDTLKE